MGNCQAAEVATVVIQHPNGKVERVYWSVSASQVMADNPGHYVAVIITAPASSDDRNTSNAESKHSGRKRDPGNGAHAAVKHLKLLRPDDTLLMGHVYRLVSFEGIISFLFFGFFYYYSELRLICFLRFDFLSVEVVRKFETKRHATLSKLVAISSSMEMPTCSTHDRRETGKEYQAGVTKEPESEKNQVLVRYSSL
jgi:PADRE domain